MSAADQWEHSQPCSWPSWSPAGREPSAQIAKSIASHRHAAELGQKLLRMGLKGCVID